ncbi:MAG: hypothetical protein U0234_16975 [Sandaracinus sp.]
MLSDERRAARGSLAAALVVLGLALLSPLLTPTPCGDLARGYPPIVAFELARSQADLDALFGAEASTCRDTLVQAIDLADWVDTFVFAPSYGLFLALFFASVRARGERAARLGIGLAVTAVAFDLLENACLLTLTGSLDAGSTAAALLPWMTGVKWVALGLAALPEAWVFLRREGLAPKVGAAMALVAPVGVALALASPARFGATIALAVTCAWVPCLGSVARRARAAATATG